jgi:hypothetical protein
MRHVFLMLAGCAACTAPLDDDSWEEVAVCREGDLLPAPEEACRSVLEGHMGLEVEGEAADRIVFGLYVLSRMELKGESPLPAGDATTTWNRGADALYERVVQAVLTTKWANGGGHSSFQPITGTFYLNQWPTDMPLSLVVHETQHRWYEHDRCYEGSLEACTDSIDSVEGYVYVACTAAVRQYGEWIPMSVFNPGLCRETAWADLKHNECRGGPCPMPPLWGE